MRSSSRAPAACGRSKSSRAASSGSSAPTPARASTRRRTIPIARLNAGAPQRLARRGAAKLGVPVSTLQYLVPSLFSGRITWVAYFKRGRYVLGDAAGRYQGSYP